MPASVVVGGQFGSEGKGKVALEIARRASEPVTAVRVGGSNSGHTAYDASGVRRVLRQIPAAAIDGARTVLPAGS
jgi:adenylosuccinate synthase